MKVDTQPPEVDTQAQFEVDTQARSRLAQRERLVPATTTRSRRRRSRRPPKRGSFASGFGVSPGLFSKRSFPETWLQKGQVLPEALRPYKLSLQPEHRFSVCQGILDIPHHGLYNYVVDR